MFDSCASLQVQTVARQVSFTLLVVFLARYLDKVRVVRLDRVQFAEFIVSVWYSKIPIIVWLKASRSGLYLLHVSVMGKQVRFFEVIMHIRCSILRTFKFDNTYSYQQNSQSTKMAYFFIYLRSISRINFNYCS